MFLPRMTSVRELQRNYRQLAEVVKKTKKPIVVMNNNQPDIALVDIKHLEEFERIDNELEEMKALETIRKGRKEFLAGKAKLLKGSLADLIGNDK